MIVSVSELMGGRRLLISAAESKLIYDQED
jgi:hypothetical protein